MRSLFNSTLGLLLIGIVFLLVNVASNNWLHNLRLDLTQDRLYTLTNGSKELLTELDQQLELYFFYSEASSRELPQIRNYARRVQELLASYQQLAGQQLRVQQLNPEPFSPAEEQAQAMGVAAVALESGQQLYFGLAGRNQQGELFAIDFFNPQHEEFLEYELSRLIHRLSRQQQPLIGLMSSLELNGSFNPISGEQQQPWLILEQIRQQFRLQHVASNVDEIPAEVDVLWLVHPKQIAEPTLYALDQFVLRGGKLLVFVDPYSENDHGISLELDAVQARSSNLAPLFEAWGISLAAGQIVADPTSAMQVLVQEQSLAHPAWLELTKANFNSEDVITNQLEKITLASAGSLQQLTGATTSFEPLITSSSQAIGLPAQQLVGLSSPAELLNPEQRQLSGQSFTLAARVSGPANSAFPAGLEGQLAGLTSSDNIQIIIVADSDLLADSLWVDVQEFFGQSMPQPWADNANFVINALDNLSGSSQLIEVRSRGRFSRPFTLVERLRQQAQQHSQEQEQHLQQRLAQAEARLQQLSHQPSALSHSLQQQQAMQEFLQEKNEIRQQMRQVRYQLNADIDRLGSRIKFFNIFLMPLLLTFFLVFIALQRRLRRFGLENLGSE